MGGFSIGAMRGKESYNGRRVCFILVFFVLMLFRSAQLSHIMYTGHKNTVFKVTTIIESPFSEVDHEKWPALGRSCRYRPPRIPHQYRWMWSFLKLHSFRFGMEYWDCQECTLLPDSSSEMVCRPLPRRHWCHAFPSQPWDQPNPRASSLQPESDSSTVSFRTLHQHGDPKRDRLFYVQPDCSIREPACFNLTQCRNNRTNPLAVYGHGIDLANHLRHDYENYMPHVLRVVADPNEACLRIVHTLLSHYANAQDLWQSPAWQNGQNHFIWLAHIIFGGRGDHPYHQTAHFGYAALFSPNLDKAYFRPEYDAVHGMRKWTRPQEYDNLDIHRPRKYIVSFKGSLGRQWEMKHYQHRWLAAEYWEEADDVLVDVQCRGRPQYQRSDYGSIMLNSTFAFCPGGASVNSFRFGEAFEADAIPVVTATFVPPLHPDVDWTGCLVRIPDTRIVDLPNILRSIPQNEVRARQKKCRRIYEELFQGDLNHKHMAMALRIWNKRISSALALEDEMKNLTT